MKEIDDRNTILTIGSNQETKVKTWIYRPGDLKLDGQQMQFLNNGIAQCWREITISNHEKYHQESGNLKNELMNEDEPMIRYEEHKEVLEINQKIPKSVWHIKEKCKIEGELYSNY